MKKQNLDREWRFSCSKAPIPWWEKAPEKTIIDLPHDYSIIQQRDPNTLSAAGGGFFPGGLGNYEKKLFIPKDYKDKKVYLEFEGVYMNAIVRINKNIVAQHPYGYTEFHCDLTPYLRYGEDNIIEVNVNNSALPNCRWYSGSGIYRHVWLLAGEKIHIAPWGVYVTTPKVSLGEATVIVKTTVENCGSIDAMVKVNSTLFSADGVHAAENMSEIRIPASGKFEAQQELVVKNPALWSIERPYLYTLRSEILGNGELVDSAETIIGIRSISFDSKNGFLLNGLPVKLKGGCVHHDCGILGAAAYDRAEERKVELLKANGFNAVRCAHNPPSPVFLDACDRLGMLVIDEVFDGWREPKNPNDYGAYFADWWQRDVTSMVLRDRNHPSIIMWSTGNEVPERSGRSDGYTYARMLADLIRSLDNTRAITHALNAISADPAVNGIAANLLKNNEGYDIWGELTRKFVEPLDVVGYNYLMGRYESDGSKFPGRLIIGAETFAKDIFDGWAAVEKFPYVIGDFVWTSLDYLGEAGLGHIWYNGEKGFLGDYPWHQAYCGDLDICGFKRPQSYYRDCVWGLSEVPYIAVYKPEYCDRASEISAWGWPDVVSSWTWPGFKGKSAAVDIYSANSEVELFLNGKSQGRKPAGKEERYIAAFRVQYEPGELIAAGYENGVMVSRTVLRTAGKPAVIRLTPDRGELKAAFGDLSFITVEVLDASGNLVHNACDNIFFEAGGVGNVLAVGSGNPISEEMYVGNQRRVHEGRALVVVRADGQTGDIVLKASAEGIAAAEVIIKVTE